MSRLCQLFQSVRLARILGLAFWVMFQVAQLPFFVTTAWGQINTEVPDLALSSSLSSNRLLFDFPGASELHRFFNYQDEGDSARQIDLLREWTLKLEQNDAKEKAIQKSLIRLLKQDEQEFHKELDSILKIESPSWWLLLAMQQIEQRRTPKSSSRQAAIESRIKEICMRVVAGFSEGLISQREMSSYVTQTYARLENNRSSAEWLENVLALMQKSEPRDLIPVLSLYSERLMELMTRENDSKVYRFKILNTNLKLNDLLGADEKCREHYPTAVAKCRYVIAYLQEDEALRLSWLTTALEASDVASFSEKAASAFWVFEARHFMGEEASSEEISSEDVSAARRLFDYRLEMLRATILLEGYRTKWESLSKDDSTGREIHPFSRDRLINSLETLIAIQNAHVIDTYVRLMTLRTLASVKYETDKPASELLMDKAMSLAWKLRSTRSEDGQVKGIVSETIVAWVEIKMARGKRSEINSDSSGLPSVQEALSFIRNRIEVNEFPPSILQRVQRINLMEILSGSDLSFESRLQDFVVSEGGEVREELLFRSLRILLDSRKGKVDSTSLSKEIDSIQQGDNPSEKVLAFYILAEAEIELEFGTLKAIIRLHDILRDKQVSDQIAGEDLAKLRLENALQLSAAASHLHRLSELTPQHPISKALANVLTDLSIVSDDDPYRVVLGHLADRENVGVSEMLRKRAQTMLGADRLFRTKQALKESREERRKELLDTYRDSKEIKRQENELKKLLAMITEIAEAAQKMKDAKEFEKAKQDYDKAKDEFENRQTQFHQQRMQQYDEIFRVPVRALNSKDSEDLKEIAQQMLSLLQNDSGVGAKSNLSYNARCVLIESLLLLGEGNSDELSAYGTITIQELDQYAVSLTEDALSFRQEIRGTENSTIENYSARMQLRNRVFDRYQLGFELAMRWFLLRNQIEKAIEIAATTTNRSYLELSNESVESETEFTLPENFIAYFCGNESLFVFWRLRSGEDVKYAESAISRRFLENDIESLRRNYSDPNSSENKNLERHLSVWLLPKQLCDDLSVNRLSSPKSCLYIAPHGPLFKIPLEGMPLVFNASISGAQEGRRSRGTQDVTMGEVKPLIYLPTLLATKVLSVPRSRQRRHLLVQCTEDVGMEVSRMKEELQTSGEVGIEVLTPTTLRKTDLLGRLKDEGGWDVIHIGAHSERPEQDSPDGSSEDASVLLNTEKISTGDLIRLFEGSLLHANHVFLSACESQVTSNDTLQTGGNTLKALGTTFLAIGAKDVIASHWRVDEESTQRTFEKLAGKIGEFYRDSRAELIDEGTISTEELAKKLFEVRNELPKIKDVWARPYHRYAFTVWAQRYSP